MVARTLASGFHHSLLMVIGIVIADTILVLAAVPSLRVFIETLGPLKEVLHPVAGIGLIVLGIGAGRAPSCAAEVPSTSAVSPRSSVLSGLFLTLGDPKALLFYLNFFPAFVGVSQLSGAEILGLLLVVTLTVGGVKIGYAGLANRAQQFFRCARLRKTLNLAAGAILAETGVFLLAFR